jgi:Tol biopolymer transport system component
MMQRIVFCFAILLLIGLATLPAVTAQKNDKAETLLQAAQHKQLVEGDLKGALQLYQQVIAQHGGNRTAVAKALVQMGKCYEKQGLAQARKAYDQVVRDYGDQREMVAEARARLSALSPSASSVVTRKAATGPTIRQVWAGPDVDAYSTPSPDEQYLAYTDWETGDLAIRELASGKKRRLTNKGSWSESPEYAYVPRWSPDGKQIAYTWFNKDQSTDLCIIGNDGSNPRVLYRNSPYVEAGDWSSDGKSILALFATKDKTSQIGFISVADGSVRVLKTLNSRLLGSVRLSPDGRYIAYDLPQKEGVLERDIFLLAADGSREILLVNHPAGDGSPIWTPDGKQVLFISDRTGAFGLWGIGVTEGKTQEAPGLIKPDVGRMRPIVVTRKGSLYFRLNTDTANAYIAELDLQTGKMLAPPTSVSERFVDSNASSDWSPDGKYVIYISQRGPVASLYGLHVKTLIIRSLESGEERQLQSPIKPWGLSRPRWSPDGRFILLRGQDMKNLNNEGLYKIDVQTGNATTILQSDPSRSLSSAIWSPDGKTIFYTAYRFSSKSGQILARDLETGQEKELYAAPPPINNITSSSLALSPDGKQLGFIWPDQPTRSSALMVIPTAGGVPREIFRVKEPEFISRNALTWTPDGRQLLFLRNRSQSPLSKDELWRISAEGGKPQKTDLAMVGLGAISVHPDGRRLTFTALQNNKNEIWVMENFLPTAQTRKASASRR